MSTIDPSENKNIKAETEAYLFDRMQWIGDGVELIAGNRDADPLSVFPAPAEVRTESQGLELSPEAESQLREIAGRFGIGSEKDIKSTTDHQVVEGGLAWKVDAEATVTDAKKSIIFAGSPNRKITREDEVTYLKNKLGQEAEIPATEYEMIKALAKAQEGFEPLDEEFVMPFGYDIQNSYALTNETTEQLVQIGTNTGQPIMILRVDREDYVNEQGENKYRNQPDSAALMGFIADVLSATGDEEASIGLNTSNTYASRTVDAVRAGLAHKRVFRVGMYGRETLADVKGEDIAEPTAINQIPGELHTICKKLQLLANELRS